jgi:hypothetical protein
VSPQPLIEYYLIRLLARVLPKVQLRAFSHCFSSMSFWPVSLCATFPPEADAKRDPSIAVRARASGIRLPPWGVSGALEGWP